MKNTMLNFTPLASVSISKKGGLGDTNDLYDSETDDSTMYQEPYRLTLKKTENSCLIKNYSCGRLCEYEEFGGPLDWAIANKFGSTPLFNILPNNKHSAGPTTSHSFSHTFTETGRMKRNNGYTTPINQKTLPATPLTLAPPPNSESFYAATDIIQVRLHWSSFSLDPMDHSVCDCEYPTI